MKFITIALIFSLAVVSTFAAVELSGKGDTKCSASAKTIEYGKCTPLKIKYEGEDVYDAYCVFSDYNDSFTVDGCLTSDCSACDPSEASPKGVCFEFQTPDTEYIFDGVTASSLQAN